MKNTTHNENAEAVRTGGFTLIELLVVIGIIGILAALVIVAINPSRQFAQARNTQRESNVSTILNAIGQNIADHKGVFDIVATGDDCDSIPEGNAAADAENIGTGAGNIDLACLVPTYIPTAIPFDPTGDDADTAYTIRKDTLGRYVVCAPEYIEEESLPDLDTDYPDGYCLTR